MQIAVQHKMQCNSNRSAMQGKELAVQVLILVDFLGQELIFSRSHLAACSYREVACGQSRNLFLHAALLISNDNEDEHQRLRKWFPGLENKRGLFQPLAVGQNYECEWGVGEEWY